MANNTLCILGGNEDDGDLIETIEYFDLTDQKWEAAPSLLATPITSAFVAAIDDTVYRFGGLTNFPQATGSRGNFDASWNFQWSAGPTLSMARANGATVVLNGQICMIGGEDLGNQPTALVETYDPATGQLTTGISLPTPRRAMAAVVANDSLFVIGGYANSLDQPLNRVDIFTDVHVGIDPIDAPQALPSEFELATAYPNPFNGQIQFDVRVGQRQSVTLRIFNLQGQPVATVYSGILANGTHTLAWQPNNSSILDRFRIILCGSGKRLGPASSQNKLRSLSLIKTTFSLVLESSSNSIEFTLFLRYIWVINELSPLTAERRPHYEHPGLYH